MTPGAAGPWKGWSEGEGLEKGNGGCLLRNHGNSAASGHPVAHTHSP